MLWLHISNTFSFLQLYPRFTITSTAAWNFGESYNAKWNFSFFWATANCSPVGRSTPCSPSNYQFLGRQWFADQQNYHHHHRWFFQTYHAMNTHLEGSKRVPLWLHHQTTARRKARPVKVQTIPTTTIASLQYSEETTATTSSLSCQRQECIMAIEITLGNESCVASPGGFHIFLHPPNLVEQGFHLLNNHGKLTLHGEIAQVCLLFFPLCITQIPLPLSKTPTP